MPLSSIEKILILAKTYPSPSSKYIETSCIAGINQDGAMRRLYPVPFRLIEEEKRFSKWQWIEVRIQKSNTDHRPESHKLFTDTIHCKEVISTTQEWAHRLEWLKKAPSFNNFNEIGTSAQKLSLALLRPKKVIALDIIKAKNPDWTPEEKEKLVREYSQGDIFGTADEIKKDLTTLKKIPYDFYYRYVCETQEGEKEFRHKLVDWEIGALYWNCLQRHKSDWEHAFRKKIEVQLAQKDLMFLMGNQHRFQDQWLIISLIYPPAKPLDAPEQLSLF